MFLRMLFSLLFLCLALEQHKQAFLTYENAEFQLIILPTFMLYQNGENAEKSLNLLLVHACLNTHSV